MNRALLLVPALAAPVLAGVVVMRGNATPEPHEAVLASVDAFQRNDVPRLLESLLSDEQLAEMEREWDRQRTAEVEPTEEFGFNVALQMLTVEGAEDALWAQARPELEALRGQTEFVSAMVLGMAASTLDRNTELTPEQRADAQVVLGELATLFSDDGLTDPDKARQAIALTCAAVRATGVTSFQEFRALEFEQLLDRSSGLLAASKEVLALYGVDLDAWCASVQAETLSRQGDTAVVSVRYEVLGTVQQTEAPLMLRDGRWQPRD